MELPKFRDEIVSARMSRGSPRIFVPDDFVDFMLLGTTEKHLIAVLRGRIADRRYPHKEPVVLLASRHPESHQVIGYVAVTVSDVDVQRFGVPRREPILLQFDANEKIIELSSCESPEPHKLNGEPITEAPYMTPTTNL
jgi:hypothetical protein